MAKSHNDEHDERFLDDGGDDHSKIFVVDVTLKTKGTVTVKADHRDQVTEIIQKRFGCNIDTPHTNDSETVLDWEFSTHLDTVIGKLKLKK